ncbi:MAG: ComEC/Rec2 family competence protein [Clostridiales bacterium]|nr:ComEC/Rec2 family competence protein [Clostridiales bacterium]
MLKGTEKIMDKLFNFRPLFFSASSFCFGILFYYLHKFNGVSAWWLFLLLPLAGTPFFFCPNKEMVFKKFIRVALLLASFAAGTMSFSLQLRDFKNQPYYHEETYVVATVVERRENGEIISLVLDDLIIGETQVDGRMNAYLPASYCENVRLSDKLLLRGLVSTDTEYFDRYGFRAKEIGDKICFSFNDVESCVRIGEEFNLFSSVRNRMEEVIYAGMDETPADVSVAALLGDSSKIESGLLENIRYGGIAHVFAVSGLHVGALYAFCLTLFKKTIFRGLPKLVRFLLLSTTLVFYAGICGFSDSVVRAMVICLFAYASKLALLKTDFLESLGLAGIVVLAISPAALFEVGFQLSFSACLGIAFLQRPIRQVCDEGYARVKKRFPRKYTPSELAMLKHGDTLPPTIGERLVKATISTISITLAAQIATAPVLLNAYGYLSGWGLLLNFLFVPILSAGFAFLLAAVWLACLLPTAWAGVILYLPSVLWSALLLLFEATEFSSFAIRGISVPAGGVICYYLGGTFLSDKWNVSKRWRRYFALLCFAAFFTIILVINFPV